MDRDLEVILNDVWAKKPYPTMEYCKIKSVLLLVTELRELNKNLSKR